MKRTSLRARLLSAPYIVWAAIFIVVPLFIVVYYAFTDRSGVFSLSNITALADYKDTFIISVWYSVIATVITLVIAYPFAYALSRFGANTQRMMMLLVMLPMWMNLLIRTYSWMNILERNGIINNVLAGFGIEPLKMIGTPGAVILGMVYNYLPYMILPIYTVMSKLDITLLEAADDLGANAFQRLRTLVIPLSMPGVISGITMVFVPSVSTFYISQKLGSTGTTLIGDVIESQFKTAYNPNLGAAMSLVLMILIFICVAVMNRFGEGDGEEVIKV